MGDNQTTHGGARKGAGRKRDPGARRLTISAKVNEEEMLIAERLGWGNASAGVRAALAFCALTDPHLRESG